MEYNIKLKLGNEIVELKGNEINSIILEATIKKHTWEQRVQFNNIMPRDWYYDPYHRDQLLEYEKQTAKIITIELNRKKELLNNILFTAIDQQIDVEFCEDIEKFLSSCPKPIEPNYPTKPRYPIRPTSIQKPTLPIPYVMKLNGEKVILSEKSENEYESVIKNYKETCIKVDEENHKRNMQYFKEVEKIEKKYEEELNKLKSTYLEECNNWQMSREKFISSTSVLNVKYLKREPEIVIKYCTNILNRSDYCELGFVKQFNLIYNSDARILVIKYFLPDANNNIKEIKYSKSKNTFEVIKYSDKAFNKLYEDSIYKITLRTIYELFRYDKANCIDAIIFNGYVKSIDKSTGQEIQPCILSLMVSEEEFSKINLKQVEAKSCFKKLKGISANNLHDLTPIAPIVNFTKEDKRFIPSYDVQNEIKSGANIAAMDWEDFEHLIRELFEKEFSVNGSEVKVTRASRDGGVDAVIFDPDPLRGGKIIIQAKRYTNIVGVSAVRDLYGTVVNEGAIKGILVSTADYGADSYDFAKDKPITLLNGSNLLYLLEKHGYNVRIDINEAKKILNEIK